MQTTSGGQTGIGIKAYVTDSHVRESSIAIRIAPDLSMNGATDRLTASFLWAEFATSNRQPWANCMLLRSQQLFRVYGMSPFAAKLW